MVSRAPKLAVARGRTKASPHIPARIMSLVAHNRRRAAMAMRVLLVAVVAVVLGPLLAGWHHILFAYGGPDRCAMTYMYPGFFRIPNVSDDDASGWHRQHDVYVYRESPPPSLTAERALTELSGTPALFIPGNGGSFRQVRSLASESARYHGGQGQGEGHHLDWFSLDVRGELSAFHSAVFSRQTTSAAAGTSSRSSVAETFGHISSIARFVNTIFAYSMPPQ